MSDTEWVYSLFIEANPIPDPMRFLASRYETDLVTIEGSEDMETQQHTEIPYSEPTFAEHTPRWRVAAIALAAATVVAAAVAGITLLTGDESGVASGGGDTPVGVQSGATISNVHEVTVDGNGCTYTGPSEVPAGGHTFVVTNLSGFGTSDLAMVVRFLSDGHTHQDLVDEQKRFGGTGAYFPRPYWVLDNGLNWDPLPEVDLADNQKMVSYSLRKGSHSVAMWRDSYNIWLCGGLDVVEP